MKFSSLEEYGLRCLLRIAKDDSGNGMTIMEISKAEGLSIHNTAKLLRILRMNGFLDSERGQDGGYKLAKPAEMILIDEVINVLGGKFYQENFCSTHAAENKFCTISVDCSLRVVWKSVQEAVDKVLNNISLRDLLIGIGK